MIQFLLLPFWFMQTGMVLTTPPVYPTLLSALEAGKSGQKDVAIFFGTRSCPDCGKAWSSFESDPKSSTTFVSTRMDADDFDGRIVFEKYDLKDVPAWVVLSSEGQLKDTWTGGWKDASGQPVALPPSSDQDVPASSSRSKTPENTTSAGQSGSEGQLASGLEKTDITQSYQPLTQPNHNSSPTDSHPVSGYALQAGYFGSSANAEKLLAQLGDKGFKSFSIQPTVQSGSTYYRVVSQTFSSEREAGEELKNLTSAGFTSNIKKTSELK